MLVATGGCDGRGGWGLMKVVVVVRVDVGSGGGW